MNGAIYLCGADMPVEPKGCRGWEFGLCAGCETCAAAARQPAPLALHRRRGHPMTTHTPCQVRVDGEWTDAWLTRPKSGRYAYVRLTTRGPEQRVPASHVRTEEEQA